MSNKKSQTRYIPMICQVKKGSIQYKDCRSTGNNPHSVRKNAQEECGMLGLFSRYRKLPKSWKARACIVMEVKGTPGQIRSWVSGPSIYTGGPGPETVKRDIRRRRTWSPTVVWKKRN